MKIFLLLFIIHLIKTNYSSYSLLRIKSLNNMIISNLGITNHYQNIEFTNYNSIKNSNLNIYIAIDLENIDLLLKDENNNCQLRYITEFTNLIYKFRFDNCSITSDNLIFSYKINNESNILLYRMVNIFVSEYDFYTLPLYYNEEIKNGRFLDGRNSWTEIENGIEIGNNNPTYNSNWNGSNFKVVEIDNDNNNSKFYQSFQLNYKLSCYFSFKYSRRGSDNDDSNGLLVEINNEEILNFNQLSELKILLKDNWFTSINGDNELRFTGQGNPNGLGVTFTDVSIKCILPTKITINVQPNSIIYYLVNGLTGYYFYLTQNINTYSESLNIYYQVYTQFESSTTPYVEDYNKLDLVDYIPVSTYSFVLKIENKSTSTQGAVLYLDNTNSCDNDYYYKGQCIPLCPIYSRMFIKSSKNICEDCSESKRYYENNKCVESCQIEGNYINIDKNICEPCSKLILNGICIDSCPVKSTIIDSVCVPCEKYIENNKCVDTCSSDYTSNSEMKCECKYNLTYDDRCIKECNPNYIFSIQEKDCILDNTNQKKECSEGTYMNNNICVDKCPTYYDPIGKFCVERCPDYTIVDKNNICQLRPKCLLECRNNGICNINQNLKEECICEDKYFGILCDELKIPIKKEEKTELEKLEDLIDNLSSTSSRNMTNIISILDQLSNNNVSNIYSPLLDESLSQFSIQILNYSISSRQDIQLVMTIIDKILKLKVDNNSSNVNSLLELINSQIGKLILFKEANETILFKGDLISIQISDGSKKEREISIKNKLGIVDFENCRKNLSQSDIYSSTLNYRNKSSLSVYTSLINSNGTKFNTDNCSDFGINIPSDEIINKTDYSKLKSTLNIDIFKKDSPFFNDNCFIFTDNLINEYNTFMTLEERQEKYNLSMFCSNNCTYQGIDNNNYIKCSCQSLSEKEVGPLLEKSLFSPLKDSNLYLIYCFENYLKSTQKMNVFLILFLVLFLVVVLIIIPIRVRIENIYLVKYKDKILQNDFPNLNKEDNNQKEIVPIRVGVTDQISVYNRSNRDGISVNNFLSKSEIKIVKIIPPVLKQKPSFFFLLKQEIKVNNCLVNLIFYYSMLHPLHMKILKILILLLVEMTIGGIFYYNQYIKSQNEYKKKTKSDELDLLYPLINEYGRILWPSLFSFILSYLIDMLSSVSESVKEKIGKEFQNKLNIVEVNRKYYRYMMVKYICFYIFFLFLYLFSLYYLICFSYTYIFYNKSFLLGLIYSKILDLIVGITMNIMATICVKIYIMNENYKILRVVYIVLSANSNNKYII